MIGHAMRHTTCSRNREHIGVAVVLARKRDGASVRREHWRGFNAHANCQPCGMTSLAVDAPQVTRIVEHNLCLAQCRALQQMRFLAGGRGHTYCSETCEEQSKKSSGKMAGRRTNAQISSPYCKKLIGAVIVHAGPSVEKKRKLEDDEARGTSGRLSGHAELFDSFIRMFSFT